MCFRHLFLVLILGVAPTTAVGQQFVAAELPRGSISGNVTDVDGLIIPEAIIKISEPAQNQSRTMTANQAGSFELKDLDPAIAHTITVSAKGFSDWTSPPITLKPGQSLQLSDIKLKIAVVETTVAAVTAEQLALEQARAEEKQRVFGIIPNFYVTYDKNAVPLTKKLKYELAFKAGTDIASIAGDVLFAAINQAADTPDYQQGAKGFGQRFGAAYADSFSNIMIGGAVLPSLLHQDPRYFYQGTGTGKSRALHAISSPFICRGDNGRHQVNFSSMGGDLIASSLANLYYPDSNRGPGLVFSTFAINSGARIANALVQEFILRKHTTNSNKGN
ncbi:carboxypeptidase-like regulatory domain-containing protein [Tunturiibacter lichenicola]|uniref:carboxypeptidase-like regulatory domain-containing protein n=1 Tax=Tunturiibacter lichenicola TaxID=2051959 RepID=UPI0021B2A8CF|nr:carboxypeptidase-like regulatory domain-containing protein [Edaphobacter lichenicola]